MFLTSHDLQNFHKKVVTMKGVFKCIKFLTFSITLALCCVLFSADTSALQLTTEVEPTGTTFPITDLYCKYTDNYSTTRANNCINPHNVSDVISQLRPVQKISTKEGYYYKTYLVIKSVVGDPQIFYQMDYDTTNYNLVSFNEVVYEKLHNDYMNICTNTPCSSSSSPYSYFREINSPYSKIYEIVLRAKNTGDYYFTLGNGVNGFVWWDLIINSHTTGNSYVGILPIEEFKTAGAASLDQKDDEDRSNIESQQSDSESGADESQGDAEQQGTTLLAAFTSFVNALTSATPSNCRIDMDLGNLDMGNVDLCQLSPPAGFSALASVFMILFCVPLSIATARKVISLFRSFQ